MSLCRADCFGREGTSCHGCRMPVVCGGPGILQMSKLCTCQAEVYLMANGLVEQYGIRRIRGSVIVQCGCPKGDGVLDLHIYLQGTAWMSAHAMQQVGREDKCYLLSGVSYRVLSLH